MKNLIDNQDMQSITFTVMVCRYGMLIKKRAGIDVSLRINNTEY